MLSPWFAASNPAIGRVPPSCLTELEYALLTPRSPSAPPCKAALLFFVTTALLVTSLLHLRSAVHSAALPSWQSVPVVRPQPTVPSTVPGRRSAILQTAGLLGLSLAGPSIAGVNSAQYDNVVRLEDVSSPLLKAGLTAATQDDFVSAEKLFTEYLAQTPPEERASGYSNRGNVRLSMGKSAEAYDDFTEAIRLAPSAPVPWLNRALAAEALGRLPEGIADCQEAIQLDPEESASYFNKGNMEAELGDYRAALDSYTISADLSPGIPGYRSREALVLNELGEKIEAISLLRALIRKNPQFLEVRLALSSIYWSLGRVTEAEEAFFDAVRYDPRVERWGPNEAQLFAESRQWPRRFPKLVESWLAFVRNEPLQSPG